MNEYQFELTFKLPEGDDPDQYFEALEASCSDAIVGTGQSGYMAFDFTRDANSSEEAIYSAIKNVRDVIENAILIEASPDLVGITDVANILEVSRQYMRKLMGELKAKSPEPVHQGTTVIYHLSEILKSLHDNNKRKIESELLDISETNKKLNMYKQLLSTIGTEKKESNDCLSLLIPEEVRTILQSSLQIAR
jgi:hypothetical protein